MWPMNVLITADLHLDLWARAGRDPFAGIVPVLRDLDALIIAGDLANDPKRNWPWRWPGSPQVRV